MGVFVRRRMGGVFSRLCVLTPLTLLAAACRFDVLPRRLPIPIEYASPFSDSGMPFVPSSQDRALANVDGFNELWHLNASDPQRR